MGNGTVTLMVTINGSINPWQQYGLRYNPFPQTAISEFHAAEIRLNSLDGDPVTSPEDIRRRLDGFSDEFMGLCIAQWRPGRRVRFAVTFPRSRA